MCYKNTIAVMMLCLVVLFSGCRRKDEEDPVVPPEEEEETVEVPENFELIPGTDPAVYICESPAMAGQYRDYLRSMGLDPPEGFDVEDIDEDAPLTGLARAEAERFAHWRLSRLPDEDEWAKAGGLVGSRPYPWDGPSPRGDVPIYLARDWLEGSEGEDAAEQRKKDMIGARLESLGGELPALRGQAEAHLADKNEAVQRGWREIKSELFSTVDAQKVIVEKAVRIERGRELSEEILSRVQAKKLPIRTLELEEDAADERMEELVLSYEEHLVELRNATQERNARLVETNRELSEEIRPLKQRIEQIGEGMIAEFVRLGEELPDRDAPVHSLDDALELKNEIMQVKSRADTLGKEIMDGYDVLDGELIPSIRQRLDIEADDEELEAVRSGIQDKEDTITKWSEHMGREFEQEPHVLKELRDLKRMRARREALEHELQLLEEIVEKMQ